MWLCVHMCVCFPFPSLMSSSPVFFFSNFKTQLMSYFFKDILSETKLSPSTVVLKSLSFRSHKMLWFNSSYQEATVRTGYGTTDWFQIGKGVCQGCILSPCLFNLYAEYIMRNTGLEEAQAAIRIAGRNIDNLRYADDTPPLWQKVKN